MSLWNDVIDPATLSGYSREAFIENERVKAVAGNSLNVFLPNRTEDDNVIRWDSNSPATVHVAEFRAFDAEPERGRGEEASRKTLDLPAIGETSPISEFEQLRQRAAGADRQRAAIQRAAVRCVKAIGEAFEYQRGVALQTGRQTIVGRRFREDVDFGRNPAHTTVAPALWSDAASDRLSHLQAWVELYTQSNGGTAPGRIVMDQQAWNSFRSGNQFQHQLANGAGRRASNQEVNTLVEGEGLPPIQIYNRSVTLRSGTVTPVLAAGSVLLLPAPVDITNAEGTDLGASVFGRTLSSDDPDWGIGDVDAPGIVTGVYRNAKPPMIVEVVADAIGMPFLANPDLSFYAKVLA